MQPVTLDDLFTTVPEATSDGVPVTHALAPHDPARFPITAARYNQVDTELAGLRSSLGPEAEDVLRGEHALDLALSTDNSTRTAEADLRVVTDAADELQRQRLDDGSPRHAHRARGERPAQLPEHAPQLAVSVRVHLESAKLLFPNGSDQLIVLPPGEQHRAVHRRGTRVGDVPDDDHAHVGRRQPELRPARRASRSRSAVFSGIGVALTIGALLFLALVGEPLPAHAPRPRAATRHAAP